MCAKGVTWAKPLTHKYESCARYINHMTTIVTHITKQPITIKQWWAIVSSCQNRWVNWSHSVKHKKLMINNHWSWDNLPHLAIVCDSQQHPPSHKRLGAESYTILMPIPPKWNSVLGIHHWTSRSQDWSSQDASHLGLDEPSNDKGNSMFPRILQPVRMIYTRLQQDSKTTICTSKKVRVSVNSNGETRNNKDLRNWEQS